MRVVIVGNGPAAIAALESFRKIDPASEVTLVSKEATPFYSPCPLAEYVEDSVPRERLFLREPEFYSSLGVSTRLGQAATALDTVKRCLTIGDGPQASVLEFDRLLIANGARAVMPPIPGLVEGSAGVFTLKTLADADGILAHLGKTRRAVVIGSGFIGLEAAQALVRRGVAVTVIEALGQVLPQMLDTGLAAQVQGRLEAHGVAVRLKSPAEAVLVGPDGVRAVRAGGVEIPCELVVCAAGVRPDVRWLAGSGVATAVGVLVNERMETNVPGVFAAGDVAQCQGKSGPEPVLANWPNASNGGRIAGLNLAGIRARFRGPDSVNVVRIFDLPVASFGAREGDRTLSAEMPGGVVRKLALRDGRIVGGQFYGDVDGAGVYLELMKKGTPVEGLESSLLSPRFSPAALLLPPPVPRRVEA